MREPERADRSEQDVHLAPQRVVASHDRRGGRPRVAVRLERVTEVVGTGRQARAVQARHVLLDRRRQGCRLGPVVAHRAEAVVRDQDPLDGCRCGDPRRYPHRRAHSEIQ